MFTKRKCYAKRNAHQKLLISNRRHKANRVNNKKIEIHETTKKILINKIKDNTNRYGGIKTSRLRNSISMIKKIILPHKLMTLKKTFFWRNISKRENIIIFILLLFLRDTKSKLTCQ